MIASGMPSLFSSTGSVAIVAFGKATPLTTIDLGLISVTGSNGGLIVALLKTKICSAAGAVALTVKTPVVEIAAPTPIWVVIWVFAGRSRDEGPFEDEDAAGEGAVGGPGRDAGHIVARGPDDEVGQGVVVGRGRLAGRDRTAGDRGPEERGAARRCW